MNKRNYIILGLLIIGLGLAWFFWPKSTAPELSSDQRTRLEQYVKDTDKKIENDKFNQFNYLDKADYLRQLGRESEALATLEAAYKTRETWKQTPDFLLFEARIRGQRNVEEGIARYESLIAREQKNEQFYSEYIIFLKKNNQSREKILEYYRKLLANVPDSRLDAEYKDYLKSNQLQFSQ